MASPDRTDATAPDTRRDAAWALRIVAVDPVGVGGIRLRGAAGAARDAWLAALRAALPVDAPWKRLPSHVGDDRLLGGLDLAATLREGRPVCRPGVLAQAHGGVVVLAMAERCEHGIAARLAQVIDTGAVQPLRGDGPVASRASFGVVALDEAIGDDAPMPGSIAERLGIDLRLEPARRLDASALGAAGSPVEPMPSRADIDRARMLLPEVVAGDAFVHAICEAAHALGIASLRAPTLALRVARITAALDGRREVLASDAALAARLVLGPRARALPPAPSQDDESAASADEPLDASGEDDEPPPASDPEAAAGDSREDGQVDEAMGERLLEAAAVTLPRALLDAIGAGAAGLRTPASASGRSGSERRASSHGRPIGSVRGALDGRARLDLPATLRAAAPWQALRRRGQTPDARAIMVGIEDIHVRRFRERRESTTVFAVDASGSQALHRLAETKGAVELLLADCYVRRDRVAVIAFRGSQATVLLAPTRSLVQARRRLAGLPGGGGTPLASGLAVARELARRIQREGGTPLLVLLTDGSANVALDGTGGRRQALVDALGAAKAWAATGARALLIDTSPRPHDQARALADAMKAHYVALPDADARTLAREIARRERVA